MYVCMCVGVTESEIQQSLLKGAKTAEDITRQTGAGSCCGSCLMHIENMATVQKEHSVSKLHIKCKS